MFTALQQFGLFRSIRFRPVKQLFPVLQRRQFVLLFIAGLGLSVITAACSPNTPTNTAASPTASPTQAVEVRIGYQKAATILNVLRTREDLAKALSDAGVTVTWAEFTSGPPMLEAINAGSIDFGYTGEAPPIFAQAAGTPLLYVAYDPLSPKSEAIIVPKDSPIQSVAELKGKKVAVAKGSNTNYLLVAALDKAGLKFTDIEPVYLQPSDARAAFEGGKVDAWAIWDPFLAVAESNAGARIIADATGVAPNRGYYLAAKSFVDAHPETLKLVLDQVKTVSEWAAKNPTEVAEFLAPELKVDPAPLEKAEKRREYGVLPLSDDVINNQQKIADTFHKIGLIPKAVNVREIIWTGK